MSRRKRSQRTAPVSSSRHRRWVIVAIVFAVPVICGLLFGFGFRREPIDQLVAQASEKFRDKDFAASERYARQILKRNPEHAQAILIAADALQAQGQYKEAVEFYDRFPQIRSDQSLHARCMAGGILKTKLKQISAAENRFRQALEIDPRSPIASRNLAEILESTGRIWESTPYRMVRLLGAEITPEHLLSVAEAQPVPNGEQSADYWQELRESAPQDPAPLLALAHLALTNDRAEDSLQLLTAARKLRPDLLETTSRIGHVLSKLQQDSEFLKWMNSLPEQADLHPGIWNLRGQWAAEHGQIKASARCYWESLRHDPTDFTACYQLGMILSRLGREQDAKPLLERSRLLREYVQACEFGVKGWKIEDAANLADRLGLNWEAFAWWKMIAFSHVDDTHPNEKLEISARRAKQLAELLKNAPMSRTFPATSPVIHLDLSSFPLPDTSEATGLVKARPTNSTTEQLVRFEDMASAAGLNFTYYNGHDPDGGRLLKKFYQMNGGGVAILDYDLDGWPDIYLTQGCTWPVDLVRQDHVDRLFRNLGNGQFVDVTADARLQETGFSQGVAVGDVNQDGAPDLYIANIGRNRLYINNGDGTFTDSSSSVADSGDRWTVSCLIADLNGDQLPELFDTNYLEGEDVFTRICRLEDNSEVTCSPASFDGSQDQLYLNQGDGNFGDCSRAAGIEAPLGRGLGVVAADFRGQGKLDLFVANDMSPNFYFRNETQGPGASPKFTETAVLAGLAFDANGMAQACMGIAVGDANHDQRLELYVTNFYDESNTLYQMVDDEQFEDVTRSTGLREPGLKQLGFGTQFLDAELDGDLDIILTNGNIDDLRSKGIPCQMPPQLMLNDGRGNFHEARAASVGSYFESKYLGRGLARIDWNRDGRDDVVISHLDAPVALLTNTTPTTRHYLCLRLVGVKSERDALGTTLTCTTGERIQMQQLTAGDGFAASNERVIRFGLGSATVIDKLQVRWMSGLTQEFEAIAADQQLILIEGREDPIPLAAQAFSPPEQTQNDVSR